MKEQIKPNTPCWAFAPARTYVQSLTIAMSLVIGVAAASAQISHPAGGSVLSDLGLPGSPQPTNLATSAPTSVRLGTGVQLQPAGIAYSIGSSLPNDSLVFNMLHAYAPSNICAAYGVDALHAEGWTGKGQTIFIVDSYGSPTALQDLQIFSATFGLPAPNLTVLYPDGQPTLSPAEHGLEFGWADETSLDLQWAHVIAPDANLGLIVLNNQQTPGTGANVGLIKAIQYVSANYPGSPISQSFGAAEQTCASNFVAQKVEGAYQQAIAAGCTPLAAAGDQGTANAVAQLFGAKSANVFPYPTASWPASSPSVTGVGGTWLQYHWQWDPQTNFAAFASLGSVDPHPVRDQNPVAFAFLNWDDVPGQVEAVWREDWTIYSNGGSGLAGGGGLSTLFATPSWQAGLPSSLAQGARAVPDVSWSAALDGGVLVYDSTTGGWNLFSGTSCGTPQIAGLVALVNQMRASMGKGPIGHLAPKLYQLPAYDFNDIVPQTFGSGANAVTLQDNFRYGYTVPGMPTTVGYDLATGLGSPKAYSLVHDLATMFP